VRRSLCLLMLAACGPKPRTAPPPPAPPEDPVPEPPRPALALVSLHGQWVPVACAGEVEGVGGGLGCLDALAASELITPGPLIERCADARGAVRGLVLANQEPQPDLVLGGDAHATSFEKTDPRDKREHFIDLDGDGSDETITLIPHDNRASYGRSVSIVDGHDPLMADAYDPFSDAADVQLLGTSDVDADARRELIYYAPDAGGFGIAVQEYWAAAEAYRLDCRDP
jgi:hypothetical protein